MRRGQWTPLNPAPRVKVDCVRCSCLLSLYVLSAPLLYDYLYLLCVRWLFIIFFFRLKATLFYFIIKIYLLSVVVDGIEEPLAANGSRDGLRWPMLHKTKKKKEINWIMCRYECRNARYLLRCARCGSLLDCCAAVRLGVSRVSRSEQNEPTTTKTNEPVRKRMMKSREERKWFGCADAFFFLFR